MKSGRTVSLRPVKNHPVYHGYACAKGRASPQFGYLKGRLLHSMKRQADGSLAPIESSQGIREVASIVRQSVERYGPRSVAVYTGTCASMYTAPWVFADAFLEAIGSPMSFHTMQIDQPGKPIAMALHGTWLAGHANPEQADAWLVIGTNPTISMMFPPNPAHLIARVKKRGTPIFVVDPRRTEIASKADVFLQVPPGKDSVVLAGLIHIVLAENLQDHEFIAENVRGLESLRLAVRDFTPEYVAQRVGVSAAQLQAVARGYARSKRGIAFAGTGPNMSPRGSLTEYLRMSLMTLCGHWRRAGDEVSGYGVLIHPPPAFAQATDPTPATGLGVDMRVRNLTKTAAGMPTSALAEEILLEGEGRVRVLITLGGNPMAAWPDQLRTLAALKKLDLLVCLEPVISDTARYAHYVIAPTMLFETTTATTVFEAASVLIPLYRTIEPYAAFAPPVVQPPEGADVIDDWQFFFDLAREMGLSLTIKPVSYMFHPAKAQERAVQLDMARRPTTEQMWEILLADSPVPLAKVMAHPGGQVFDMPRREVMPKAPGWTGKLDIGNADMLQDLRHTFLEAHSEDNREYPFLLIGRRLKDRWNSSWREHSVITRSWPYNPAFMNPADMSVLGLSIGDIVEISSRRAALRGVIEADRTMLPGVIAMTHAWGASPEDDVNPADVGANTGLLTDNTSDCDRFSAMPRMGAIPVRIRPIKDEPASVAAEANISSV